MQVQYVFWNKIWRTTLPTSLCLLRECVFLLFILTRRRPSGYSKEQAERLKTKHFRDLSAAVAAPPKKLVPRELEPLDIPLHVWTTPKYSEFRLALHKDYVCPPLSLFLSWKPQRPLELQNQEPQPLSRRCFCVKGWCFLARSQKNTFASAC